MNTSILYVPEIDISLDDGSGINERNFVKALLERNINVLIPQPKNKDTIKDLLAYKNLKTTWYLNRRNPLSYLFFVFKKIYDIHKINKQLNIDTVVFRLGLFPLDIFFVKKIWRKKVFLKHLTFLSSSQKQNIVQKTVGVLRRRFVNHSLIDGCDTPSYMTKKIIEETYNIHNIHIAKNGTHRVNIEGVNKNKEFIYIGRLSKLRNTDKLLEAFSKTTRKIDIFGFGEMEGLAKEYADKYPNINFHGKVSYKELTKILPAYKFGVDLTYVKTQYGRASYSQKIAQYLSFKLNVIAIKCEDNKFIEKFDCGQLYNLEEEALITIINTIQYHSFSAELVDEYIISDEIVNRLITFWIQK